jgi:hypothetical protein
VQFNPVLDLEAYVPAIQSKMREARFPDYRREVFQQVALPFGHADQSKMFTSNLPSQSRHVFGDIDLHSLFILETNALSFQTTRYDTFEAFSSVLLKGLGILHEALRLDFVERIGLRYLDAVQPLKESETLREFLVPEVLGHAMRPGGQLQHSMSETVVLTAAGQLVSRVLIRDGQIGLPLELVGSAPALDPRFTQRVGVHAIVDTDASVARREAFDLEKVRALLTALHDDIVTSFNATVTDHARACWAVARAVPTGSTSTVVRTLGLIAVAGVTLTGVGTGGDRSIAQLSRSEQGPRFVAPSVDVTDVAPIRTPAENLARIREVLKPAVSDLAITCGVSRQSVYNWLKGEPVSEDNGEKLQNLAQAADVLDHQGIVVNAALLKRKFANGRTLMQAAQAGESARDVALQVVDICKREQVQRERMAARFANRAKSAASADFDLPMASDPV